MRATSVDNLEAGAGTSAKRSQQGSFGANAVTATPVKRGTERVHGGRSRGIHKFTTCSTPPPGLPPRFTAAEFHRIAQLTAIRIAFLLYHEPREAGVPAIPDVGFSRFEPDGRAIPTAISRRPSPASTRPTPHPAPPSPISAASISAKARSTRTPGTRV
jgi:hypothetical protein